MLDKEKRYYREYMSKRYTERMTLAHHLLGNKCKACDSVDNLEIDHIDWKEKSFTVGKFWNCAKEKFLLELEKCQLLCRNCHIEKSKIDIREIKTGNKEIQHGTHTRYQSYKCRCEMCRSAYRIYKQSYRKSKNPNYTPRESPNNLAANCGTYKKYRRGCKCLLCKNANSLQKKFYQDRKSNLL